MVFDSLKSHALYHGGNKAVKQGDVWHCEESTKYKCPICGGKKFINAILCGKCNNKKRTKNIPSKNNIWNLLVIKRQTFVSVGNIYGVSDNAVRKWCDYYGIPRTSKKLKELRDL